MILMRCAAFNYAGLLWPTPYQKRERSAHIFGRQTQQCLLIGAVAEPFGDMADAKPLIELTGRVPVEHVKIDPALAALDRDRGKPRHQPSPDTKPRSASVT